jgi:hypothetical protein
MSHSRTGCSDGRGFIGALIGAVGTVFAGWLALSGVRRQIAHTEQQLLQSQAAAKAAAIMAITQPVHAAGTTLYLLRPALAAVDDTAVREIDQVIERSIAQLANALEHFTLREVARDLDTDSRQLFLGILVRLSSFVTIATTPAGAVSRTDRLRLHIQTLEGTHFYISLFDADLGRKFAEDGEMAIAEQIG